MNIDLLAGDELSQWIAVIIIAVVILMLTTAAMLASDTAWLQTADLDDEPTQFDDI